MKKYFMTEQLLTGYERYLHHEERAENTISKYLHDLTNFQTWVGKREVSKELVTEWKENLCSQGYSSVTVNAALAALHGFFAYMGWSDCRVKYLKIQRRAFRDASKELTKEEYTKLVDCAKKKGNRRLALLMETICATGIRVSEIRYITVESVKRRYAEITLKGKVRTILLPNKLAKKLLKYAKIQKIASGEIFLTASGNGISRRQIWKEMKNLCKDIGVDEEKVFPHNLRHLFARTYYKSCHDIVHLADVLGHSSIETTRIYLITTSAEHARQLDRLGFVS